VVKPVTAKPTLPEGAKGAYLLTLTAANAVKPKTNTLTLILACDKTTQSIAGYNWYWGGASRTYTNRISTTTNIVTFKLNAHVHWFFAATTFTTNGAESPFSDETSFSEWAILSTLGVTNGTKSYVFLSFTNSQTPLASDCFRGVLWPTNLQVLHSAKLPAKWTVLTNYPGTFTGQPTMFCKQERIPLP